MFSFILLIVFHSFYWCSVAARPAAKNQDGNAFEKITKLFERKPKQEEPAKAEPIVEKAKPVAEKVELVKTEPIVERAEPVVEKAEPVIEKVEPVIEKAEPVVEEAESPKVEPVMEEPAAEMESPEPEPVQEKPSAEVEPAKVEPVTEQVAVEVEPLVELESPKVESVEEEPAAEVESPKAEHATEGQAPQEESEAGVKLLAQDTTTEVQPEPEKALKALLEGDLGQGHEEDQDLYTTRGWTNIKSSPNDECVHLLALIGYPTEIKCSQWVRSGFCIYKKNINLVKHWIISEDFFRFQCFYFYHITQVKGELFTK